MKLFWWIVHELFQLAVSGQHDRRGGDLVQVTHLEPDDPVLDVVDYPDAAAAPELGGPIEQLDEPEPLTVERDRTPPLE